MGRHIVVTVSELGVDCWSPTRFLGGHCERMDRCKYGCKSTCEAHQDKRTITRTKTRLHADGRVELIGRKRGM